MIAGKILAPIMFALMLFGQGGCEKIPTDLVVASGDARDLPAFFVADGNVDAGGLEVKLVQVNPDGGSTTYDTLLQPGADAAYVDAMTALEGMAKGRVSIEILAVTSRDMAGVPNRLLVVTSNWAERNPDGPAMLLEAHQKAIRYIRDNESRAAKIAAGWLGMDAATARSTIKASRWESGLYIDEIISLLDDLLRQDRITGPEGAELSSRLLGSARSMFR